MIKFKDFIEKIKDSDYELKKYEDINYGKFVEINITLKKENKIVKK